MTDMFTHLAQFLLGHNNFFMYLFLFISAVLENLIPPIPGDTITALGAFLVGTGRLSYIPVFLATTAGSVMGFMLLFFLGRYLEKQFFLERDYRYFSKESILKAEKWFSRWGYWIVLANRFFPGIRSVISLVSGISMLNPLRVALLSLVSAFLWNGIWIQAGFMLGNNWETVKLTMERLLRNYNIAAGIMIIGAVAVFMVVKRFSRKNT